MKSTTTRCDMVKNSVRIRSELSEYFIVSSEALLWPGLHVTYVVYWNQHELKNNCTPKQIGPKGDDAMGIEYSFIFHVR